LPYLSIDVGSSSVKAGVISEDGILLGFGRAPSPMKRGPGGVHEADPLDWIEAAFASGRTAICDAGSAITGAGAAIAGGLEIRAIAVSGHGPTLLAADSGGRPIRPALAWMDRRASREAEEVSRIAGFPIDAGFYLPKALRLWRSFADVRERARWFFSCPEYLAFALCGEAATYLPRPGYEPYIWDERAIGILGLPKELFPPFVAPAARIGALLAGPAEKLGLSAGIPVVSAFPDFLAAVVGSAAVEPGVACDRSGTSEALNLCASSPYPSREMLSLPHPIEGLWNLSGGVSAAGAAIDWLDGLLGPDRGPDSTASVADSGFGLAAASRVSALAQASSPGAGGLVFIPYLAGERAPLWDLSRRGAFVGLSLGHGRPEMARAVCESLAFGLRIVADLARSGGFPLALARASGFAARDDFLCSLKAEALGLPVEAPAIADCELVGDAAACAVALGDSGGLAESAASLYRSRALFEPVSHGSYDDAYGAFRAALAALGPYDASRSKEGGA
jgi:xylulokinase